MESHCCSHIFQSSVQKKIHKVELIRIRVGILLVRKKQQLYLNVKMRSFMKEKRKEERREERRGEGRRGEARRGKARRGGKRKSFLLKYEAFFDYIDFHFCLSFFLSSDAAFQGRCKGSLFFFYFFFF